MVNSKFKFNLKLHFHKDLNVAYSTKHKHNLLFFSLWINYVHQSLHKIFTDWWHQIHFNALYFSGGDIPLTFSRILHFGTGSKEPPPLSFYPEPSICYWQEKLPKTITCTNTLLVFIYQLQTPLTRISKTAWNLHFWTMRKFCCCKHFVC